MDGPSSKKFKLDLDKLNETIDDIPTQTLFKAYQRGELSTSILSKDDPQPTTSAIAAGTAATVAAPPAATPTMASTAAQPSNRPDQDRVETRMTEIGEPSSSSSSSLSPTKKSTSGGKSLLVNSRQRGNPILKFIRNVAWEYVDMEPDYVMGRNVCALYLSLRYHNFNPNYIHDRIGKLGKSYELRVLLVQVDIPEPHHALKELTRLSMLANMTLLLAWTAEEAGRYLDTFKAFEHKPADLIKEKVNEDFLSQATDVLTSVRSINKTDVATLLAHFGSIEEIMKADVDALTLLPGFGIQKAKRLHDMFRIPFAR